jgi:hypothetical protein
MEPHPLTLQVNALSGGAFGGASLNQDYHTLRESDLVAFQDDRALYPPFTNARVPSYRQYMAEEKDYVPIMVSDDVTVYSKNCK